MFEVVLIFLWGLVCFIAGKAGRSKPDAYYDGYEDGFTDASEIVKEELGALGPRKI